MKKALIGAGGSAREIMFQIGEKLPCFVDDIYYDNSPGVFKISDFDSKKYEVLVTIGDSQLKSEMVSRLPIDTKYFTFIHPTAQIMSDDVIINEGCFIGANSIITCNVKLGKHSLLNRGVHIGHDSVVGDYFSAMPGSIVSGNVIIGNKVYMGTNSTIREKIKITDNVVIGLNSGVLKDINKSGVYVGTPVKQIK
jgi:sugar O-acyltransferase (sialic acid O-acetyltransferase NeuD family)